MVKFKTAAIVAGIFVIIGAVLQGAGGAETLNKLGSVDALGGAFTVALCSALTVYAMTYYNLPVSTTQAIVGAIIGWCFFTHNSVDYSTLGTIASSWVIGPVIGAIITPLLYLLLRIYLRHKRIHVIKMDSYIRLALIIVGAFGAYSLGANNIANVMGVFVASAPDITLNLGFIRIGSEQMLFLLGGIAIAVGILTYSKKVMGTIGTGILALTPEAAIVVVLSQAIILFIFSSSSLSNFIASFGLPAIPQVPISSTQVVVGSVLGIGLIKGVSEVDFKLLGKIMIGWILTPIISCIVTFFSLFFVQNVFSITVSGKKEISPSIEHIAPTSPKEIIIPESGNMTIFIIALTLIIISSLLVFLAIRKYRMTLQMQRDKRIEESHYTEMHKALTDIEVKTIQLENTSLATRLDEKRNELINFALGISEQRNFLERIKQQVEEAYHQEDSETKNIKLKELLTLIQQKMSFSNEMENLYLQAEKVHNDFPARLGEKFPTLTEQEKRLTMLLRVGFSSKEIAALLNISTKSVEINRYRLRKKLHMNKDVNLAQFIKNV